MRKRIQLFVNQLLIILLATIFLPCICSCTSRHNDNIPIVVMKDTCSLSQRVTVLEEEYARLSSYQIHTDTLVERSFNAVNNLLMVLTAIIAVAAIYLTWYINKADRKLQDIEKTITTKQEEVEKVSKETATLLDQIKNNTDELFVTIRRKDTEYLLTQLVNSPQDIVNIERLLLARELVEDDFKLIKKAYDALCLNHLEKEISGIGNQTYQQLFMALFFKHFFGKTLEDDTLREHILDSLVPIFDGAFPNEIQKTNDELASFVSNKTMDVNRGEVLYIYLYSLKISKHKDNENLISSLKEMVTDQELWSLINKRIEDEE